MIVLMIMAMILVMMVIILAMVMMTVVMRLVMVFFFQIFRIDREGEKKRYKPFKELPNRKLLWHGSRATNFAGILSQGLRIAPPEAPVVS
jgi:hypothetical protein